MFAHVGIEGALGDGLVILAGLGCVYVLFTSYAVLRFARVKEPVPSATPPVAVSILTPLCGAEPGLMQRLRFFATQTYDGDVQIVCGVRDSSDAAIETVRRLPEFGLQAKLDLQIDARQHGSNRKVSNLVNMFDRARHDVLVIADSDIEVKDGYLVKVLGELQKPGVGAVSCLFHGVSGLGCWSRQAALAINIQFLPNVVTAITLRLARPCFGATIALDRATLAKLHGLQAFADSLADDYALGEAVRASDSRVAFPHFSVGHVCWEESLRGLLSHELRTARTIRTIAPIGYCGSLITHPLPIALIALTCGGLGAASVACLALGCRLLLCLCVEKAFGLERQPYWLIPLRDLLSFAVFVTSFCGSAVSWRGSNYRVLADGQLVPGEKAAP